MNWLLRRTGMSRIDILFAIAVTGVLGAIVWGNLRGVRADAYEDVVTVELGKLRTAQDSYWSRNQRYAPDTAVLGWQPAPQISLTMSSADFSKGVDVVATHSSQPGMTCRMYVGTDSTRSSGTVDCNGR